MSNRFLSKDFVLKEKFFLKVLTNGFKRVIICVIDNAKKKEGFDDRLQRVEKTDNRRVPLA